MSEVYESGYVVGGSMQPDAPTYVKRRADDELLQHALGCGFCYVLSSRQTGKSTGSPWKTVGRAKTISELNEKMSGPVSFSRYS